MPFLTNLTSSIPSFAKARLTNFSSGDDVVVVSAVRTSLTKARKGGFKDTLPEELLEAVFIEVVKRGGVDPALIGDIAVGSVATPGGGAKIARMAQLSAGIPHTVPLNTVNRQCSSGLAAFVQIANEIKAANKRTKQGAGVESMTAHYGSGTLPERLSDRILSNPESADCLIPMGITSENVAKEFGISRREQDEFAAESFRRAAEAQREGKFRSEIVPVKTNWKDPKTEEVHEIIVDHDDGIRQGVTAESLANLKPAFAADGSTHAGNASQVTDGAAAVLLARRSVAQKLGLPILGKYVTSALVGVPPRIMGVGPAYAIPKVLQQAGLSKEDIDFYEINEAFASQALMSIKHTGLPLSIVNPVGGAIALGHPLGCTGARQIATGFATAKREGKKVFVTSMCMGTGMGYAAIFVSEQ
ncbi:hypothetical protein I350_03314 [Cryptococcus amylolentus CBS 6273]|uniref:Acetyl-CoA C-acetyltransferase n=1 Tax=Cryptococcus amylolentus CBS 6273 TaxID=1296118 RepID=A0A1E3K3V3_9TREE|nr:hypothetical protein I350_03314 [Cryptococcus amylolentus CBS 6273]